MGSQVSVQVSVVQGLPSSHELPAPAQTPPLQTSPVVHGLASLHEAPLLAAACWHAPDDGVQLSAVQGLLSSQLCWMCTQPPLVGLQVSSVQRSLSLQSTAVPTQAPA